MKERIYKDNERVEYYIRPRYVIGSSICKAGYAHRVGYVKKAEHKFLRGWVYYICVAIENNYRVIDIVPQSHIFGIVKSK